MSDCSTQAMKPKDPPRTCETCDRYYNVRPLMRQGACALDDLDEDGCVPIRNADDEACARWLAIELPLEERCQQLEQLARDMYNALYLNEICSMESIVDNGDCQDFRSRLEALGVSLDG